MNDLPQGGRRHFLRQAMAVGSSVAAAQLVAAEAKPAGETKPATPEPASQPVRVGLIGAGDRGTYLLRVLLAVDGVEVRAICDADDARVARAQRMVEEQKRPKPEGYADENSGYRRLCERTDLDLVVSATPWPMHTAVALAALEVGKHVASEVPLAGTVDECWQQVEAATKAGKHCTVLENYCYQRDVMMIGNLVRQGLFGEILHAEGGYQKDGRDIDLRLSADGSLGWLGKLRSQSKGNTMPTHDLGPISQWLGIHRGDRFEYLVAMGGNAAALNEYGKRYFGPEHFLATTRFDMSDINCALLRTERGRTVYLLSDTLSSRPQPRSLYRLMGSKGIYDRTIDRLYLEGKSPRRDRWAGEWEAVNRYFDEHDHPDWRALRRRTLGEGFAGADFLCVARLVRAIQTGVAPDITVFDAAAMSCVVELTERSARSRSKAVDFPDFTRGAWRSAGKAG